MGHWKRKWSGLKDRRKVFNLIGLTTKVGEVASEEFSTERAVEDGTARLVIVSEEAPDDTRKVFISMCTYYQVPIYFFGRKDELGHVMEEEYRTSLVVLGSGLGRAIVKQMNINGGSKYES